MTSDVYQYQNEPFILDPIDEQGISADMTFAATRIFAVKLVILIFPAKIFA